MGTSFASLALLPLRGFSELHAAGYFFFAKGKKVKIQNLIGPKDKAEAQIAAAITRRIADAIGRPQEPAVAEPATAA